MSEKKPAKMDAIAEQARKVLDGLTPHLSIRASDNLMSSVDIRGHFLPQEQWANGIFHNGPYFIMAILPEKGKRYYSPEDGKVRVECYSHGRDGVPTFRTYTGPAEKAIEKVRVWLSLKV